MVNETILSETVIGDDGIGVVVLVEYDDDPMSPREWDNLTVIRGSHSRYEIGDGEPPAEHAEALERGGLPLLARYLRLAEGALIVKGLGMYDHSGVSYYTFPVGGSSKAGAYGGGYYQHADWDSGAVGYVYVTRDRVEALGAPLDSIERQLDAEVQEYSDWASGNVYGFRIVRPCGDRDEHDDDVDEAVRCSHAETLEAISGFIGDADDCLKEGIAEAQAWLKHSDVPQQNWPVDHAEGE